MTSCLTSKIQNSEKDGDFFSQLSSNVKKNKSKKNVKLSIINEEETQLATSTQTYIKQATEQNAVLGMVLDIRQIIASYRRKLHAAIIKTELAIQESGEPKERQQTIEEELSSSESEDSQGRKVTNHSQAKLKNKNPLLTHDDEEAESKREAEKSKRSELFNVVVDQSHLVLDFDEIL